MMTEHQESRLGKFYYIAGFLTSSFVFLTLFLFIGHRRGFAEMLAFVRDALPIEPYYNRVIHLPKAILNEVIEHNGVIDKAGNPTKNLRHNTIMVQPDKDLEYVLRPNVTITASMLKSIAPFNFAPPTLYLEAGAGLSKALKSYIRVQSRLDYSMSISADGFRRTIPLVESNRKILMVGDSVPFGIAVNDELTMASCLQKMVGDRFKIINAGVGGYNGQQAFRMAKRQSQRERYVCLIYVACQNDFMESRDWLEEAQNVLTQFSSIADEFQGNIVVFFHTYLDYCAHDVFLDKGWQKGFTEKTDTLRRALPLICRELQFAHSDWCDAVAEFQKENQSILARFALYADYCHLSPLGNQKAAEVLFKSLQELKLVE
jgi:hypothetical protein